jgi:PLP dependent protein
MSVTQNLQNLRERISPPVNLIGVSKLQPVKKLREAYEAGLRHFGENRVQELQEKTNQLPSDIQWHFIGRLQRNKVKALISLPIFRIHSVDSERLFNEIAKEAKTQNKEVAVLLQIHIAQEESKAGFSEAELNAFLKGKPWVANPNVKIFGLMGMATFTEDQTRIQEEFKVLAELFKQIQSAYISELADFKELSMGMSGDWELAVSAGSTWVRIGSALFGSRN